MIVGEWTHVRKKIDMGERTPRTHANKQTYSLHVHFQYPPPFPSLLFSVADENLLFN